VNRKVLSLEAAGQLRVPETDYSDVVHPTEPSQFAASISHPASALVIGFMGKAFIATIFGIRKCSAECRTYPFTAVFSSRDTQPSNADPHIWSQLERLIQGRLPTCLQPVQNKIAARAGN